MAFGLPRDSRVLTVDDAENGLNIEGEVEFHPEAIQKRRCREGEVQYLVKWKGVPELTWEFEEDLECINLIKQYEKQLADSLKSKHESSSNGNAAARSKRAVWSVDCGKERLGGVRIPPGGASKLRLAAPRTQIRAQAERGDIVTSMAKSKSVVVGGSVFIVKSVPAHRPKACIHPMQDEYEEILFHGTRRSAADAICLTGFRCPKERSGNGLGAVRPHMFGKGIYFTSSREKASHFGDTIIACRVRLGRMHKPSDAELDLDGDKLWNVHGCDSVYASKGTGGNCFDEYIVFDPYQISVLGYL
jgi:hypothetical protein